MVFEPAGESDANSEVISDVSQLTANSAAESAYRRDIAFNHWAADAGLLQDVLNSEHSDE